MNHIRPLLAFIQSPDNQQAVSEVWQQLDLEFAQAQLELPPALAMARRELSFHQHVRLLGHLCRLTAGVPGDLVEIGVWKGKSLALMSRLASPGKSVIGVDPFELPNQWAEATFYQSRIFPEVTLIQGYAEYCRTEVLKRSRQTSILHIDGGHAGRNVILDFLLYADTVSPGGFVVFDDYRDAQHSPEVGPAIDLLRVGGYFKGYCVMGAMPGFDNSYVIQRL